MERRDRRMIARKLIRMARRLVRKAGAPNSMIVLNQAVWLDQILRHGQKDKLLKLSLDMVISTLNSPAGGDALKSELLDRANQMADLVEKNSRSYERAEIVSQATTSMLNDWKKRAESIANGDGMNGYMMGFNFDTVNESEKNLEKVLGLQDEIDQRLKEKGLGKTEREQLEKMKLRIEEARGHSLVDYRNNNTYGKELQTLVTERLGSLIKVPILGCLSFSTLTEEIRNHDLRLSAKMGYMKDGNSSRILIPKDMSLIMETGDMFMEIIREKGLEPIGLGHKRGSNASVMDMVKGDMSGYEKDVFSGIDKLAGDLNGIDSSRTIDQFKNAMTDAKEKGKQAFKALMSDFITKYGTRITAEMSKEMNSISGKIGKSGEIRGNQLAEMIIKGTSGREVKINDEKVEFNNFKYGLRTNDLELARKAVGDNDALTERIVYAVSLMPPIASIANLKNNLNPDTSTYEDNVPRTLTNLQIHRGLEKYLRGNKNRQSSVRNAAADPSDAMDRFLAELDVCEELARKARASMAALENAVGKMKDEDGGEEGSDNAVRKMACSAAAGLAADCFERAVNAADRAMSSAASGILAKAKAIGDKVNGWVSKMKGLIRGESRRTMAASRRRRRH